MIAECYEGDSTWSGFDVYDMQPVCSRTSSLDLQHYIRTCKSMMSGRYVLSNFEPQGTILCGPAGQGLSERLVFGA